MSESPIAAAKEPVRVELEEGKSYFWCACGRSQNQPFCDGSHAGTGLSPVKYPADKSRPACHGHSKATGNQPICDGSHKEL